MRDVDLLESGPPPRRGESVQSPTLPLPPPRDLGELDRFLEALSTVAIEEAVAIRTMFAGFRDREALAAVFHEALAARPCGDIGRFMLLLSAVGELAAPTSLVPLHEVVWAEDAELLMTHPQGHGTGPGSSRCRFPASGMIQARAVEMFAWVAAGREDNQLLRVVAAHPALATRLAAADAFLFAHGDAADALQRVLAAARPEDRNGIGVPRLVRGCDREVFDRALEQAQGTREAYHPRQIAIRARPRERGAKGAR